MSAVTINVAETVIPSTEVKAGKPAPVSVRLPATYFRLTLLRNEVHFLTTTSSTCPNVIPRGEVLPKSSECAGLVQAFESYRRHHAPFYYLGLFVFYFGLGLIGARYFRHRTMRRSRLLRAQAALFGLVLFSMAIAKAVFLFTGFPAIMAPVLLVPMLVGHYFRRRVALAMVSIIGLAVASLNNFDVGLFLVLVVSGLTAALASRGRLRRNRTLFKAGIFSGWIAIIGIVVVTLVRSGTLGVYDDPAEHLDPRYSLWIAAVANGLISALIAMALAPMWGRMCGVVSRSRLVDLQDLNQRLLKRIQSKAPGTWEHSRAMANLAEAAVNAIGGNTALVRVGAYYHDVGKSNAPEFFIENQKGEANPHNALDPMESAARIFKHVIDGTRLLRQEGIPEDVVEFCYSHHGTSVLEYFWYKTMSDGNPNDLSEKDFSYPGHKPTTRETGILMLVDAIEAGARTVDVPDKDAFSDLVRRIIFSKLAQGQLDESGLSLKDLRRVTNTLVDTLVNMYHARIKYPWQTADTGTGTSRTKSTPPEGVDGKSDTGASDKAGASDTDKENTGAANDEQKHSQVSGTASEENAIKKETETAAERGERRDPTPTPTNKRPVTSESRGIKGLGVNPPPEDLEEPAWAMASREEDVATQETVMMRDGSVNVRENREDDAPEVLEVDRDVVPDVSRSRPQKAVK